SLSTNPPSTNRDWSSSIQLINGNKTIETEVEVKLADTGYIKLYRLQLLAGGNLPYSDSLSGVIINTAYLRAAGLQSPQQAIGKPVVWLGKRIPIVGVVADFHQKSLHETIKPLIIANWTSDLGTFNIALQPQNAAGTVWQNALAKIEEAYKQVYPAAGDFTYSFVDDTVAAYYTTEQNTSQLLMWATGITMAISSLGLLALVIYTTSQRTKEIGIRKIVGATVMQIITLLCKDFLKPVALAFVIAIPVTWWGAHKWLENFAYTATMPWWLFAAGGLAMLAIAFLVMFARTYRAAMANPAESLRTE
ncbi:MAG TPA: FtsX-like permease family protein, partial [Chitinophagaceae bacterium]|nr:FtsX-like permease family protein [Chitinophagaceae bacterium]